MSKRLLWLAFSILTVVLVVGVAKESFVYAAAPLEAPIEISLVSSDGKTAVTGATAKVSRLDSQTETDVAKLATMNNNYINTEAKTVDVGTTGTGRSINLPSGKYAITISKNDVTMTTFMDHKVSKADVAKTVKLIFLEGDSNASSGRVGSIAGKLSDKTWLNDGAVTKGIVIAQSKTTVWTTKTDNSGFFQLYLMPGAYKVIAVAGEDLKDSTIKRSYFPSVVVVKGMNVTPIAGITPTLAASNTLGFQADASSITNTSTTYKGQANNGAKVTAFSVSATNKYTWLGEALVKDSKTGDEGSFVIKVSQAQPGGKVIFLVEDKTGRVYASSNSTLNTIDLTVTADTTKNELGQPIDLTFKDLSKIYGKTAKVEMRFTPNGGTATNYVLLNAYNTATKAGDYTFNSGKLTILAKTFFKDPFLYQTAGKYEIKITQDGFETKTVEQTVTDATTAAATLGVTSTPGSSVGTAKLAVGATSDISKVYYEVATTALSKESVPKAYKDITTEITAATNVKSYNSLTGITSGIDAVTNKFLRVYEVVSYSDGATTKYRVVRFKEIVLSTTTMNAKARSLDANGFALAAGSVAGTMKVTALPAFSVGGTAYKYAVTAKDVAAKTQPLYKANATDYATPLVKDADITVKTGEKLYIVEVDNNDKILSWIMITIP